jgi:hypothetical protein
MEDKRKRNPWGMRIFASLAILMIYALSAGPALMLHGRVLSGKQFEQIYRVVYWPIICLSIYGPESVYLWMEWYFSFLRG